MAITHKHAECGHIFTTYILPDIFHFVAFIIGFIYFRATEGEPMYSLMEKVTFIYVLNIFSLFILNRYLFMLIKIYVCLV